MTDAPLAQREPRGAHLSFAERGHLELAADYVVVGSGAGGAAAGVTLCRAGRSVVLCERGPWRDPEHYPESVFGALASLWADFGAAFASGDSLIPLLQGSAVGGSTTINSAIVVRTPHDVLAQWAELGLGEVFTPRAMARVQDVIEHDLAVTESSGPALAPHSEQMLAAFAARGLEGHATLRAARGCQGSGQCLQGCRNGAKQSTNVNWVPEMLRRGATVLSCAPVERVVLERGVATGVRGRFVDPDTRRRGGTFTVRARRGVLVAASATGSAPLLQRSRVRLPYLGHGFRAHPGAGVTGVYPQAMAMHRGTPQGAASVALLDRGIKLESLAMPLELVASRVPGAGRALLRRLADVPRMAIWIAAIRADAVGTVRAHRLLGTVVRYVPTRADVAKMRTAAVELAQLHFAAGATHVLPGAFGVPHAIGPDELALLERAPLENRCWTWAASHLFGGCVMGSDPQGSVVAPDLHVRGVRRLHVVDASALPTSLGVNPQHTIMAVAMLVAERLANDA